MWWRGRSSPNNTSTTPSVTCGIVTGVSYGIVGEDIINPKTIENKLRRAAKRQGLRLEKSKLRDPRAIGYGTYQLVDETTNTLAAFGLQNGYGLTLDEIAQQLNQDKG